MIRSILSVSVEKFHLLDSPTVITAHERNILKDVVEILTPFEEATDVVQVDLYPSSGYVLPCIRGLKHQLTKMSSKYHSSFVKALKSSLHSRMVTYEMNNTYILAATLDPRFKLFWCHDNEENVTVKCLLIERIASVSDSAPTPDSIGSEDTDEPKKKKQKNIFSFIDEQKENNSCSKNNEVEEYLKEPSIEQKENPLKYWKSKSSSYPNLAVIAKQVLSIPGSSAPVERLFSVAGKVFKPDRCRMKDSTFEKLMFIKCNKSYKHI